MNEQTNILNQSENVMQLCNTIQANLENVKDLSNVCRTCATVTEFVLPIFDGEGAQNNLADKILKYLPIQVSEHDELPLVLCYQCANMLLDWERMVQACKLADKELRARLCQLQAPPLPSPHEEPEKANRITINIPSSATEVEQTNECEKGAGEGPPKQACEYCVQPQHSAHAYTEHLVTAHADLLFHCDECDTYVDRKDLIQHMSSHAVQYASTEPAASAPEPERDPEHAPPAVQDPVPAPAKEEDRRQESAFSDHSDTEDGFGPLPDSVFEAIEDSQDSDPPDRHRLEASPSPPPSPSPLPPQLAAKKTRTCRVCSKSFTAASSYFYHMKHVHEACKEHECGVCGRRFATRAYLRDHASLHTGECRYTCERCGKPFRTKASLYIHAQTHSETRRWACELCPRAFPWRQTLIRHMARHAAERTHACAICGRAFAVRCDLRRHVRTHDAPERHACAHCGAVYAQLRYLRVHQNRKHPKAPTPA